MTANFLSGESLYQDVVTYSQFGDHRTASEGELGTTEWMTEQLKAAGLKTTLQTFPVHQFFLHQASLTIDSQALECFPWWPPQATGPKPIQATLANFGAEPSQQKGRIALVRYPATTPVLGKEVISNIQAAIEAGAIGVVVVCQGIANQIVVRNTASQQPAWPVPVVLVRPGDEATLATAAEQGAVASLLVEGRDEPNAQATNLIGTLERGQETIVISTPKSGWFTCGGERGPGVALFLALARWVSQRQGDVSYVFDANTGHEFLGLGARRYLSELAPRPEQVLLWIHLGANIATWDWEQSPEGLKPRPAQEKHWVVCSGPDILPVATSAFAHIPGIKPIVGQGLGEMRLFIEAGYRGFGVNGNVHPFFHTPSDGPEVTAPELLEPVALALTKALELAEAMAQS